MSPCSTSLTNPERSRRRFVRHLSRLPVLNAVQFGFGDAKDNAVQTLDDEIFVIGHRQDESQLQHFKPRGEIARLLKACAVRFNDILQHIQTAGIGGSKASKTASLVTDWFAFDPSAYALTYELDAGHIVVLATPTLRGVYSSDIRFETLDDTAAFLDSVLVHEIAHCVGSMKHDGPFKKTFKRICKLENLTPKI